MWHPPVNVSHLNTEQQAIVKKLLFFAQDDDIGCIPSLQMIINLMDDIPVQHSYAVIPSPLYKEVKEYIQDLLAKNWVIKSKSP